MTSNQVNYAGVKESERHNKESEEEITRHNTRVEELEQERNDISKSQLEWQKEYETRTQNWKEEYDQLYLEYQKATTAEKLRLEQEMNNIKAAEQRAQEQWQQDQAYHLQRMDENNAKIADENKRHNEQMEKLEQSSQWIQDKQVEYQHEYWSNANSIGWYNATSQRLYNNDWFTIQTSQQQQNFLNYQLQESRFQWEQQRMKYLDKLEGRRTTAQDTRDYSQAILNGINVINQGLQLFNPIGGMLNGKAKTNPFQEWENLWK